MGAVVRARASVFLLRFTMLQKAARRMRVVRIQSLALAVDVLDHTVLINDKRGAVRHREFVIQNAVLGCGFACEIAKEGEGDADLLSVCFIGKLAVNTDSQNLRSGSFELGNISLICLEFFRSTTRKRKDVKCQHHILFAEKLTERNLVAVLIGQCEVRRLVADLERPGLRCQRACQCQNRGARHEAKPSLHRVPP